MFYELTIEQTKSFDATLSVKEIYKDLCTVKICTQTLISDLTEHTKGIVQYSKCVIVNLYISV